MTVTIEEKGILKLYVEYLVINSKIYLCIRIIFRKVWTLISRAWSSLDLFEFEFSYLFLIRVWVFRVSNFPSFSGLRKTRRVFGFTGLRENFDQNLAWMHHFLPKFSIGQNWIRSSLNFRVFFEFGFWQSLKIGFFSSSGLG